MSIKKVIVTLLRYSTLGCQILVAQVKKACGANKKNIDKIQDFNQDQHSFILIFVGFEEKSAESAFSLLETAKNRGAYVIFVTNNPKYDRKSLPDTLCDVFIDHGNIGWDFSQYKTAVQYIDQNLKDAAFSKVIFANDSVFYFKDGLDPVIAQFLNPHADVVGVFENFEVELYHLSSWLISVDKHLFFHPVCLKFWATRHDIKNKFYAIRYGEIRFTQVLLSLTNKIKVVYSYEYLMSLLHPDINLSECFDTHLLREFYAHSRQETFIDYVKLHSLKYHVVPTFTLFLLQTVSFPFLKKDFYFFQYSSYSSLPALHRSLKHRISEEYFHYIYHYYIKRGRYKDRNFITRLKFRIGIC